MDQQQASDALNTSTGKKLNAKAPEFVPRSSAAPPPLLRPFLQPIYVRPPSFVPPLPPPYYGYEHYYQHDATPFYGYNVSPVCRREYASEDNNASNSSSLSHSHHKIVKQVSFTVSVVYFEKLM